MHGMALMGKMSHRPHIRPSVMQQAKSNQKAPPKPSSCPLLRTYQAVICGILTTVKVYGRPRVFEVPKLPKQLYFKAKHPDTSGGFDPEWIR